ncbi:MAG: hypothetical protein ACK5QT_07415, partial [Oligoflexia bacterium]
MPDSGFKARQYLLFLSSAWLLPLRLILPSAPVALAAELSPEALVHRCTLQLSSTRARIDAETKSRLASGELTYLQLCMELLDLARFEAGTTVLSAQQQSNPLSLRVLDTLNRFHNSFFSRNDGLAVDDFAQATHELQSFEFGHYFTWSLFSQNVPVEAILTHPVLLEPARAGQASHFLTHPTLSSVPLAGNGFLTSLPPNPPSIQAQLSTWTPALMPVGRFIGVQPAAPKVIPGLVFNTNPAPPDVLNYNINTHLGVGLLGDPTYQLLNTGAAFGVVPDGGLKNYRRFSETVFKEFLCRDLPVIRPSDVPPATIDPASPISFNRLRSCQQCHQSMEPMAATVRNFVAARSARVTPTPNLFVTIHGLDRRRDGTSSSSFAYQEPNGSLVFRDLEGQLIQQPVQGVTGLAEALVARPDFYACVASRYYQFLTGTQVQLFDPGSPTAPSLSEQDLIHVNFVKQLGQD